MAYIDENLTPETKERVTKLISPDVRYDETDMLRDYLVQQVAQYAVKGLSNLLRDLFNKTVKRK